MVTMPVPNGFKVTSPYGPRWGTTHWGTDYGCGDNANKPVYAVKDGTVTRAGAASGFGRWVTIDHPASNGGGETVYGHIIPEVSPGQKVREGQRIGRIDGNQNTNGGVVPHLHFEWHRYSWSPPGPDRLDPEVMLKGAKWVGDIPAPVRAATEVAANVLDWTSRFAFGRPRPTHQIRNIIIHVTVNTPGTPAENVANYQITSQSGSYHELTDTTIKHLIENTDEAHPRSRGEHAACEKAGVEPTGSSPLTRGAPPRRSLRCQCHRLIPAHAGSTRHRHRRARRTSWRHPPPLRHGSKRHHRRQ